MSEGLSEREGGFRVRRILVALDASSHSLAALGAAADLAAALEAELDGLFVEDINLIRLAELPLAREVRHTASLEELDPRRMERALAAQATEARQALATAAGYAHVPWSFRVVRGDVAQEVLAAASQFDLVSLGKQGRSKHPRARLGSTALRLAAGAPGALLLVEHGVPLWRPVLVLYDGSEGSHQALDAAARLAPASGGPFTVLVLADAPDAAAQLEHEAAHRIEARKVHARFHSLHAADLHEVLRAVQSEGCGLVMLSARSPLFPEATIRELLGRIRNPVLLIR
jgi:nucleotide-binding universal stress UspA family protein